MTDRFTLLALIALLTLGASAASGAVAPARLSLAGAVAYASGAAPSVVIAGLDARAAEGRRAQARAALLPSISAAAYEQSRTFNSNTLGIQFPTPPGTAPFPALVGPFDVVDARLRGTQTLFDPAGYERWRAAGAGVDVSRQNGASAAEQAGVVAAATYLGVLRANALYEARREDEALAGELKDLAETRLKSGVTPAIDAIRARTQYAQTRAATVVADAQRERAQVDLARALGADPAWRFELSDSLSESLAASAAPGDSVAALVMATRRPDVAAADADVRRLRAERVAIQAERLPRLDVSADWGASGQHFNDAIDTREVGVAVTLPIVDGLQREGRLSERSAQLRVAEVKARDLRDEVAAQIQRAVLDLESGRQQVAFARERLALAGEEIAQARDRFANGVAGNIEVIDAQATLVQAREADIDARYEVALARVALARAAGVAHTLK